MTPVFQNCNVCGRGLIRNDELAVGMCAICANEEVEEDGDEIITPMPKACTRWPCIDSGKDRRLVKRKGFMVCPVCSHSYGKP